jgi:serine/threonine protein kinase
MGVVYLAHNKLMARDEVLKVIGRQVMDRPGVLDRFLREIQAVAKLRHPNIVTAYHATRMGESLVFTMEYVPGYDLSQIVKSRGPLAIGLACNFVHQAALGLQHAHEEGLVHRDIKPSNLMFMRKGDRPLIKILDFGLAKANIEGQRESGLTREGQMLGTPEYIAPEQIRDAQSADARADIYSLGCTLYYLLAGRPPFAGDSLWDIYQAHFSMDASPLNLLRPEIPAELAAVVTKMMAKDPERRFQAPAEVAKALAPFFKPAALRSVGSHADVSRMNQSVPPIRTEASRVGATTGEPASPLAPPARPAREQSKTGADGVAWESLIDITEDEPLVDAVKPKPAEPTPAPGERLARRPPWIRPAIAAASVLAVVALGVIIYVATDYGRVKIIVNGPEPIIAIDGKTIRIEGVGDPITLRAGEHELTVKRRDAEAEIRKFTVRRDGNEVLRIVYEPMADDRPAPGQHSQPPAVEGAKGTGPQPKVSSSGSAVEHNPAPSRSSQPRVYPSNPGVQPQNGSASAKLEKEFRHPDELNGARSIEGTFSTRITFVNKSQQPVRVYWLDYEGRRARRATLQCGEASTRLTFLTHPYVITDELDRAWNVYYPTPEPRTVIITGPPQK